MSDSPNITRAEVLARAQSWADAHVPYSQSHFWHGYRQDCVGLVSMAWGVATPGMGNTINVLKYVTPISKDDLKPGDALLNAYGGGDYENFAHIILFGGWANAQHTAYNGYEETPPAAHFVLKVPYPYWSGYDSQDYQPVRFKGIQEDTQTNPGQPASYAGKIVQWNGDTKAQKTAWLVSPDLKRYWIPDASTFNCLTSKGFTFAGAISSTLLDQLPDQTGQWARCGGDSLSTNQYLFRGSSLTSSNGLYHLELQRSDGNLVLYGPSGALWANSRASDFLVMQGDNNLVTYRYGTGATWAANTGNTGANTLVVQNDGNLVLYAPGGVPIWDRYSGKLR